LSYFFWILVSLAAASWINLGDPHPAEELPPVVIEAHQAGIPPKELVKTVTVPLEKALGGIDGVRHIRSLTAEGRCLVRLEIEPSADSKKIREAAAKRLTDAKAKLPEACVRQGLQTLPEVNPSFFVVALQSSDPKIANELSALSRNSILPRLERLPNIADVRILGDAQERVRIICDPTRVTAFGLSMSDVLSVLKKQSDRPPKNARDLEGVVVSEINGQTVYLRDLAIVEEGRQWHGFAGLATRPDQRHPGAEHSPILVLVQAKAGNLQDFAKNLDLAIKELKNAIPSGIRIDQQVFQVNDPMIILSLPSGAKMERRADLAGTVAEAMLRVPPLQGLYWFTAGDSDEVLLLPWRAANSTPASPAASAQGENPATQLRSLLNQGDLLKGAENRVVRVSPARSLDSPLISWPGDDNQIVIRVSGEPFHELRQTDDQLHLRLRQIDGVVDLHTSLAEKPTVEFLIDDRKCKAFEIKPSDVREMIRIHQEGIEIEGLKIAGRSAFLALPSSARNGVEGLRELSLRNGTGLRVPITSVAAAQFLVVPRSLYREGGKNCIVVSCNVQGRTLAEVRQQVRKIAQELSTKEALIEVD
jgi:multidrug efflux pump subunit AcrB